MLSKKAIYITTTIMLLVAIISVGTTVFAAVDVSGLGGTTSDLSNKVTNVGNMILGVVQAVASVVAVIILIILGIKYVMASAEDKADIKKSATGYIIGAIVLFGASGILQLIKTFTETAVK